MIHGSYVGQPFHVLRQVASNLRRVTARKNEAKGANVYAFLKFAKNFLTVKSRLKYIDGDGNKDGEFT